MGAIFGITLRRSEKTEDQPKTLNVQGKLLIISSYSDGVDLNRNYDIKFDKMPEGSSTDECQDDYRGTSAFSEPETQAIRDLFIKFPKITSALNFHSYANLWIHPYSYNPDQNKDILQEKDIRLWKTYNTFSKRAKFGRGVKYGNAVNTIKYTASGEASDWMLSKLRIFAFSPELGIPEKEGMTFYPEIDAQKETIK